MACNRKEKSEKDPRIQRMEGGRGKNKITKKYPILVVGRKKN